MQVLFELKEQKRWSWFRKKYYRKEGLTERSLIFIATEYIGSWKWFSIFVVFYLSQKLWILCISSSQHFEGTIALLSFEVIVPLWFLTADDIKLLLLMQWMFALKTFFYTKSKNAFLPFYTQVNSLRSTSTFLFLSWNHSQCFLSAVIFWIFVELSKVENRFGSTKNHVLLAHKMHFFFCFIHVYFLLMFVSIYDGFHRIS